MSGNIKIINIRHKTFTLEDEEILQFASNAKFRFKFIPLVSYNEKSAGINDLTEPKLESFYNSTPFTLYELGVPIAILRSYMGSKITREDLISAKRAFKSLKNFASQCYERIIADLCCQIIMREITKKTPDSDLVFFIEKSASDKMLGRLASLYLNLDKITICFLVFDPSDLMTTVMSYQTGKLHFDIHRLRSTEISDFVGPYPGDSEDSLIQTYFYKPANTVEGGEYRPMRLDIFTQGLLRDKVETKKLLLRNILHPDSPDKEPSREKTEPRLLMPMGFEILDGYLRKQKEEIRHKLLEVEG